MKVFVTGGSGFVGSAVVPALIARGHEVLALARSDASANALRRVGALVLTGSLEDVDALRRGASQSEGVIHMGFNHDFSRFAEACALDRRVIETIGEVLSPDQPFVVTSGTAMVAPGRLATEDDTSCVEPSQFPRAQTELAVAEFARAGQRVGTVRLAPTVHGEGDHGFVSMLIENARTTGVSAYIGAGTNRWNAVHKLDAAQVFVGAIEQMTPNTHFHAVGEAEVVFKDIAAAIGRGLELPTVSIPAEQAPAHFGFLEGFAALDCPVSSALTRARLDWTPTHPTLLDDLAREVYFG